MNDIVAKDVRRHCFFTLAAMLIFSGFFIANFALADTQSKTDPLAPTTDAPFNSNPWTTPGNAFVADVTNYAIGASGQGEWYSNFGITIPPGAYNIGIDVQLIGHTSGAQTNVALSWNGGSSFTADQQTSFDSNDRTIDVGGPSNTWGRTWLPGDFTNGKFEIKLYANTGTTWLDAISVQVYYTKDTTPPAAFAVGAVTTTGGTIVSGKWNSTNTGISVVVPVANDTTLVGGTIQLQANAGSWVNIGSRYTIASKDINSTNNAYALIAAADIKSLAGFAEGVGIKFGAVITDLAGNSTTGTASATTINVDQITPTITSAKIQSSNANVAFAKTGDTITLTFSASEAINTPTVAIAGYPITVSGTGAGPYTATYVMASGDAEGVVSFNIVFSDLAGNAGTPVTSTTDSSSVTFGKSAPTLSQTTAVPTPTKNNTPNYTFSSSKAGTITYGGDCSNTPSGSAASGSNTITFNTLADGVHSNCTIKVTDAAGNQSSALAVSSFMVDTILPTVSAGGNQTNSITFTQTATASDSGSGVNAPSYQWSEVSSDPSGGVITFGTPSALATTISASANGSYVIKFSATDNAGNVGSATMNLTWDTVNVTPPTITAHQDVLAEATSSSGAVVSYALPTATDYLLNPVVVTCLPARGSTFKLGDTTVNCTATDSHNNTSTSSFTIHVADTTKPNITAPAEIDQSANGKLSTVVLGTATATDTADPNPKITNNAPSTFPIGETDVTWTATDVSKNSASATQKVVISPGPTASLFLTAPVNLAFDQTGGTIAVTGEDQYGNTNTNDNSTAVVLSFDDSHSLDVNLVLQNGVILAPFSEVGFFSDNQIHDVHITASSPGLADVRTTVTFTPTADYTTGPSVADITPENGSTSVQPADTISITFSKPLNPTTVSSANIQLMKVDADNGDSAVPAFVYLGEGSTQVLIQPKTPLDFSATYYFAVSSAVKDLAGNPLSPVLDNSTESNYSFTTIDDPTVLAVTEVDLTKSSATADDNFDDGWQWVFHVTVPTNQTQLSMSFDDWTNINGVDTIPAADNIEFYSPQSSTYNTEAQAIKISANRTTLLSQQNQLGGLKTPPNAIDLSQDLDPSTPGRQIKITVDAQVPSDAAPGSYSTQYSITTQ
ncbi:MAG: Ig-like domain-containing protein [Candidatus Staskawiczbacteria bacterium]